MYLGSNLHSLEIVHDAMDAQILPLYHQHHCHHHCGAVHAKIPNLQLNLATDRGESRGPSDPRNPVIRAIWVFSLT